MAPVPAPTGTEAIIEVAEMTLKVAANLLAVVEPVKLTPVVPAKFVPVMVTVVPTPPVAGLNAETVGGAASVNALVLVAVTPPLVTLKAPEVVPAGTVAVICVLLFTVNTVAAVVLNFTAVAAVKPVPEIVTAAPTAALLGVKPDMETTVRAAVFELAVPTALLKTAL
jgi:hypothetical protein